MSRLDSGLQLRNSRLCRWYLTYFDHTMVQAQITVSIWEGCHYIFLSPFISLCHLKTKNQFLFLCSFFNQLFRWMYLQNIANCVKGKYLLYFSRGNTQTPPMFSNPNQAIILDNFHVYSDVEDTVKVKRTIISYLS